jgi:hypothetical protein
LLGDDLDKPCVSCAGRSVNRKVEEKTRALVRFGFNTGVVHERKQATLFDSGNTPLKLRVEDTGERPAGKHF